MNIANLIKIIITLSFFLVSCSDDNEKKNNYQKKTNIPLTGQSIDKKADPSKKVNDFY